MPTNKELEEQLEIARKDIETLARMAGGRVRGAAYDAKAQATDYLNTLSEEAKSLVDQARERGEYTREMAEDHVRENPLMAVGLAMGAGFILASLMRR